MTNDSRILIACEFSGIVRDAFIAQGYNAMSADLLDSEQPGPHWQGDVSSLLQEPWDLVIAHPPCTRLCNSGVRWLHERNLWNDLEKGAAFFLACLNANAPLVAVENPIMHKYAIQRIGRKQNFCIQPYEFGEPYTKRTCFWTKGLPVLKPTNIIQTRIPAVHYASPGPNRWRERSRTYKGIAKAMAIQWGRRLDENDK